jgi:hypothetical protein
MPMDAHECQNEGVAAGEQRLEGIALKSEERSTLTTSL